ncbi:MAG TPA: DUF6265 family protein, partial [Gemmatimonadales bacterium]|nr:DUF6265 family protein [Gemmatimonadales bacterium]
MRILMFVAVLAILAPKGRAISTAPVLSMVSPSLAQLSWMAGCLEMRSGDRLVEEQRMDVRGGSMLGMGRTTTGRGLGEYELTLIHEK